MAPQPTHRLARPYGACTHVTMVRVYSYILRCDSCGNYGHFGWLYRCSQDQEEILRNSISNGEEVTFDDIGKQLVTAVQPRNRGPEKRSGNAASFLEEMPPRDITTTYTTDQLMTIFNQRKHLGDVLRRESFRMKPAPTQGHDGTHSSSTYDLDDILETNISAPWVPKSKDECQYKICSYCRPGGADRAYISLDGIAKGNIPATAATGYGFHLFRERPVCNSQLLANIGLRSSSGAIDTSRYISDAQLASHLASQLNITGASTLEPRPTTPYSLLLPHGHLPRSPGTPNLATQVEKPLEPNEDDSSWQDTTASTMSLAAGVSGHIGDAATEMEEQEEEQGSFLAQPLTVANGVAVLEQSVEMHEPDLVTQV
ncbi:hypothetical protein BDP81DRAFT_482477 [Colletotrichum phormii]|uniref:Uncharacterized protein n=1 Tax=Colletotrichum phormii TaxID=359342 RepID=A0AAI9ZN35_9PEZI|nr:uncharacterized protein BDP81DRAFT_482477 [Colletotrichum phormii]KAK1634716.1 hypothetical protein BDP81DRAFT_482477 [Colletotrichum phormii]